MKRTLFHIGFPKTSSSLIQFGILKRMHEEQRINLMTWRQFDAKESHDVRLSSSLFQYKQPIDRYKNLRGDVLNVISDESLTAPFALRKYNFGIEIPSALEFPKIVAKIFKDESLGSVDILMIIRNQADLLYSQHVEEYKLVLEGKGNLLYDSEGRIKLKEFESYHYADVYKAWSALGNVHVVFFEDIKYDFKNYCEKIANIIKCYPTEIAQLYQEKKINAKLKSAKGYYTINSNIVVPFLTSHEKQEIKQHFYESNLQLIDLLCVSKEKLLTYGYL